MPEVFNFYKDACAISAVTRMVAEIKKYRSKLSHFSLDITESLLAVSGGNIHPFKGSLSYSWDYGDIHYVQLHNYPSYTVHLKRPSMEVQINKSLDWLKKDLKAADTKGKVTVINFHDAHAASIEGKSFLFIKRTLKIYRCLSPSSLLIMLRRYSLDTRIISPITVRRMIRVLAMFLFIQLVHSLMEIITL